MLFRSVAPSRPPPLWTAYQNVSFRDNYLRGLEHLLALSLIHIFGPTIMYAHMQAIGLVNDHLVSCFRYHELRTDRTRGDA